jgi:phosphoribosylglycinamide formyltransferase-1
MIAKLASFHQTPTRIMPTTTDHKLPIVVLISGNGSNLQALMDAVAHEALPVEIRAVISNRANAEGLARARRAGITTHTLEHGSYPDRDSFDAALMKIIDGHRPELVVLAGFMRILTQGFVEHYSGRLINIHPSLLPELPGLDTHRRAIEAGKSEHGASVHFVTPQVDGGPVILQARVALEPGDTPESLNSRVLSREHIIYPLVLRWFAEGRLRLLGNQVILDGAALSRPLLLESLHEVHATS